jgi:hypothetical protein
MFKLTSVICRKAVDCIPVVQYRELWLGGGESAKCGHQEFSFWRCSVFRELFRLECPESQQTCVGISLLCHCVCQYTHCYTNSPHTLIACSGSSRFTGLWRSTSHFSPRPRSTPNSNIGGLGGWGVVVTGTPLTDRNIWTGILLTSREAYFSCSEVFDEGSGNSENGRVHQFG